MFGLKCKHSGYYLWNLNISNGDSEAGTKADFTMNTLDAICIKSKEKAIGLANFLNCFFPSPLPYEINGATHVLLEVVEL